MFYIERKNYQLQLFCFCLYKAICPASVWVKSINFPTAVFNEISSFLFNPLPLELSSASFVRYTTRLNTNPYPPADLHIPFREGLLHLIDVVLQIPHGSSLIHLSHHNVMKIFFDHLQCFLCLWRK